jgi:hypothetical protein
LPANIATFLDTYARDNPSWDQNQLNCYPDYYGYFNIYDNMHAGVFSPIQLRIHNDDNPSVNNYLDAYVGNLFDIVNIADNPGRVDL